MDKRYVGTKVSMILMVCLVSFSAWAVPGFINYEGKLTDIDGYSLNVCAGKNPICDVNMDLDPQDKKVIRGDMRLLPYKSNTFDTVVSDPPWKISYYERFKPFFECVRVCKVGGKIIYNATWIPMTPSKDVELKETWIRQDNDFSNASVISIFKKVKNTMEYNKAQEALLKLHEKSKA